MKEDWKTIEGYVLYEVSNLGRVKRLAHSKEIFRPDYGWYTSFRKEKILKPSLNKDGYTSVKLYNAEGASQRLVHRLVAQTFIPNPENKPTVNHINGIKDDNNIVNLEWSTDKEQSKHANDYNLVPDHLRMRGVLAYDSDGNFIEEYQSMKDAERDLDILQVRISEMCRGIRKKPYKGYFFEYVS